MLTFDVPLGLPHSEVKFYDPGGWPSEAQRSSCILLTLKESLVVHF